MIRTVYCWCSSMSNFDKSACNTLELRVTTHARRQRWVLRNQRFAVTLFSVFAEKFTDWFINKSIRIYINPPKILYRAGHKTHLYFKISRSATCGLEILSKVRKQSTVKFVAILIIIANCVSRGTEMKIYRLVPSAKYAKKKKKERKKNTWNFDASVWRPPERSFKPREIIPRKSTELTLLWPGCNHWTLLQTCNPFFLFASWFITREEF